MTPTRDAAQEFFALHQPGNPFVLPCVWDIAIAKLLSARGFPAIGTTSLGIAAAHGYQDENRGTQEVSTQLIGALKTHSAMLISCDIEDGYSDNPTQVAEVVRSLDVQGVNIEDSLRGELGDPLVLELKIQEVKAVCPRVFVNARVDTFWTGTSDLIETLRRIERYAEAGADGIFVPGNLELAQIQTLARETPLPLNVLATARHTRSALADAGVARVSTGSLLYRSAITTALNTALSYVCGEDVTGPVLGYDDFRSLEDFSVN